ncbi:MAG: 30S ribosomal protein S17 [bacterium]
MDTPNKKPQTFSGTVVKTAMKDTATVAVNRYVKHPKYKKFQVKTTKFLVDDKGNTAKVGDKVTIVATRPISKLKSFRIASIDLAAASGDTE